MDGPIQDFSSGYYSIDLRVIPYEQGPAIDSEIFSYITDTLCASTDAPVWMKSGFNGSAYFQIQGEGPMPTDLIGLPREWMQDFGLEDDDRLNTFLICKPGRAHHISQSEMWGNTFERDDDF